MKRCFSKWWPTNTYHEMHSFEILSPVVFSIFTKLCHCHHHLFLECLHPPERNAASSTSYSLVPLSLVPWQPQIYFLFLWICQLQRVYISEITKLFVMLFVLSSEVLAGHHSSISRPACPGSHVVPNVELSHHLPKWSSSASHPVGLFFLYMYATSNSAQDS